MKLTNATEQAIAIIALLTTQLPDIPASSATINKKLSVSPSYSRKLLRKLVVAEIIGGVSGNNGGFYLERSLDELTLLEVVEAIEGPFVSFPDIGVLERAFANFNELAQNGDKIVSAYFAEADQAWSNTLGNIKVNEVLSLIFSDYKEFPKHDWNQLV
ncbi:RrF2 family transcriptional regulator [Vagococcus silagei]|uniref:Rrf2 family transcriptional regulator n=1 Tax=Vagococcus silagei TaxID=2508885 RepID=A0A4S3B5R2_9ENTE|nr:Rrf2 family transcriptional regulator [Vagococcus silagei]THB60806.1 Rrf2 family transcriptional regulator [Vagococcus silagei]